MFYLTLRRFDLIRCDSSTTVQICVMYSMNERCQQVGRRHQTATAGCDEVDGADTMTLNSLVTAVPLPSVTWPVGEEVRRPLVLDSLGEPEQHAGVVVSGPVSCAAATHQRTGARFAWEEETKTRKTTKGKSHRSYMDMRITAFVFLAASHPQTPPD